MAKSDGWVDVLGTDELQADQPVEVFASGRSLVLVRLQAQVCALDSVCPHAGGPLADGHLDDGVLTCPWHGWSFDVLTGVSQVSDDVCVPTYPVKEEAGRVWIQVPPGTPG